MSDHGSAVFLSYASQDAEAARRICEALRTAGVEVWFDQNELVGGDAWDAKIRKQIAECALFVPIISANTQARREGYFRIEWRLAAQRTHAMSDDTPFVLPAVIDDTRDADARVPAEFKAVQWTRLSHGDGQPLRQAHGKPASDDDLAKFCARVQRLLTGDVESPRDSGPPTPAMRTAGQPNRASVAPAPSTVRRHRLLTFASALVVIAAGITLGTALFRRGESPGVTAPGRPLSAAQQLVEKARQIFEGGDDMSHETYALAEELLLKAEALDPAEPSAWALHARVSFFRRLFHLDRTTARLDALRMQADRVGRLAPGSLEARLADAYARYAFRQFAAAIETLEALAKGFPDDWRVPQQLGRTYVRVGRIDEASRCYERALRLRPDDPTMKGDLLTAHLSGERFREVQALLPQLMQGRTNARLLGIACYFELLWGGNLTGAAEAIERWPAWFLLEDRGAAYATLTALWRREPAAALRVIEKFPRPYVREYVFAGPRAVLLAWAHEQAGRTTTAREAWRSVLEVAERELKDSPDDGAALHWRAWALARLGDTAAAGEIFQRLTEQRPHIPGLSHLTGGLGGLALVLGRPDEALAEIARVRPDTEYNIRPVTKTVLRLNPVFDPIRSDPRFQALIEAAPGPEEKASASGPSRDNAVGAPRAAEKSVAVLAFKNLSGDPAREFFSDGLSEAVAEVLGRVRGLRVVGSTSAFSFKGKNVPAPEIARQLGVSHLVEGTVLQDGTRVRITAKLIQADGFQVWVSDRLDHELKNIFTLHDEVAGLIARNLELTLGIAPRPAREINPDAYQSYLAGRAAVARAGMADLREALPHFEKAVALEPRFTAAWVQLASAHIQLGRWGGSPTQLAWPASRAAIARAVALEPESPDVLLALGWIRRTADWDWRGAEQAYRRALALRPSHPETLSAAAVLFFNIGKTEEAFRHGREAARLDPLNAATQIDLSLMFCFSQQWAEAERAARRAVELGPGGSGFHTVLAWSLIRQQRYQEAEAQISRDPSEVERLNALGLLAIVRGDHAAGREILTRLEALAHTDPDRADLQQSIAWVCAGLGKIDRAFAALERARASRDPSVAWSRTMWPLQALRSDPRWAEFLRSVGLADEQLK